MSVNRNKHGGGWLGKIARGAASLIGLGEGIEAICALANKRDASQLWDLDPKCAPPRKVRRQLLGIYDTRQEGESPRPENRQHDEHRSMLVLQLDLAMCKQDIAGVRAIS